MNRHRTEGDDVPEEKDDSDNLIAQFVQGIDPGAVVTKFVIMAEGFDADGSRASYTSTHDGASPWDTMGLLIYGMAREFAQVVRDTLEEDDEEDDSKE